MQIGLQAVTVARERKSGFARQCQFPHGEATTAIEYEKI